MKTLTELSQHLKEYREGNLPLPDYNDLIGLVDIPDVEPFSSLVKLRLIHGLCGKNFLTDFQENYVENTWLSSEKGLLNNLNIRQIEIINIMYNRHFSEDKS